MYVAHAIGIYVNIRKHRYSRRELFCREVVYQRTAGLFALVSQIQVFSRTRKEERPQSVDDGRNRARKSVALC